MSLPAIFLLPAEAGLGNQLFIASAASAYQISSGRKVILLPDRPSSIRKHGWFLNVAVAENITVPEGLISRLLGRLVSFSHRFLKRSSIAFTWLSFSEHKAMVDKLLSERKAFLFYGYFQTALLPPLSAIRIQEQSSYGAPELSFGNPDDIAVHIRRGDYAIDERYGEISLGILLSLASKRLSLRARRIILFTDSPERIKSELLKISFPSGSADIVLADELRKMTVEQEFLVLSGFKKIVISNSTFSWWAAYLGAIDKTIHAPWPWTAKFTTDTKLLPDSWVRYDSML